MSGFRMEPSVGPTGRVRLLHLPREELLAQYGSAVKPEIQPVCAPRCKTSLCPCCKRDSSGELVLIRGIRTVAFFLFCCVGSMRTLGPWILSVFELLTMVALNVVVNPDSPSPSHLPGNIHNYALSFCCHVEDVFAISIVRSVVLSVAYGAGLVPSCSFLAYRVFAWATTALSLGYLAVKAPLFHYSSNPARLGLQVAVFAVSAGFALLHLGSCFYSVAWHQRRRAMGLEGLGGPFDSEARDVWQIVGGTHVAAPDVEASVADLMQPDSCFINLSGLRVHYKICTPPGWGRFRGPLGCTAVVLVHGFGAGAFAFRHVAQQLANDTGCAVVSFDRPGFGLTSRPRPPESSRFSPYSPTMHAQLALDLVLSLGFDRCMLAGHADGALIALMAASFAITGPPSQPGTRRASMDRVRPMGMEPQHVAWISDSLRERVGTPLKSLPRHMKRWFQALGRGYAPLRVPEDDHPLLHDAALSDRHPASPSSLNASLATPSRPGLPAPAGSPLVPASPAVDVGGPRRSDPMQGDVRGASGSLARDPEAGALLAASRDATGEASSAPAPGLEMDRLGQNGSSQAGQESLPPESAWEEGERGKGWAGSVTGPPGPSGGYAGSGERPVPPWPQMQRFESHGATAGAEEGGAEVPEVLGVALLHPCLLTEGIPQFAKMFTKTRLGRQMLLPLLRSEVGEVANRRAWHNAARLTPEVLSHYKAPLHLAGWDVALVEAVRWLRREVSVPVVLHYAGVVRDASVPVMLVAGSHDSIVPPAQVVNMARSLLPRATIAIVPECGHMSHEERPAELEERLHQFVAGCVGTAPP